MHPPIAHAICCRTETLLPARSPTMLDTSRSLISTAAAAVLTVRARWQAKAEGKKDPPPETAAWTLDGNKPQQPIRFAATGLDASQNRRKDLSAYVNGKWLASN